MRCKTIYSILIVDDEQDILNLFVKMFSLSGFEVKGTAINGEEAIKMFKSLKNHNIDVILMDHRMPVKNGIDATKEILEIDPNIKVVFVSADSSIKDEALAIGAVKFVEKPAKMKLLIEEVKEVLNS